MMWEWTCLRLCALLHLESRSSDGWLCRSLYGGSESGTTWKLEAEVGSENDEENTIFLQRSFFFFGDARAGHSIKIRSDRIQFEIPLVDSR